jgi:hypothetical protein
VKPEELDKLKELSEASKPKTKRMREWTFHVQGRAVTVTAGPDTVVEGGSSDTAVFRFADGRRTTVALQHVYCTEYREFDVTLPEEKRD